MATMDVAKRYVELVTNHQYDECLDELFAKDAFTLRDGKISKEEFFYST